MKHRPVKSTKKRKSHRLIVLVVIALGLGVLVQIARTLLPNVWHSGDKLALALTQESGDVSVYVLDTKHRSTVVVTIPAKTIVDVAQGYGEIRIENVGKIASQHGKGVSELLPATLMRTFGFPVHGWVDSKAASIFDGGAAGALKAVFSTFASDLSFGDRVKIGLYLLGSQSAGRVEVDLADSALLVKGEDGDYQVRDVLDEAVSSYFAQGWLHSPRIRIRNSTGGYLSDAIKNGLETMGGKVVMVSSDSEYEGVCTIASTNVDIQNSILRLWECVKVDGDGAFDVDIRIGRQFANRY